MKTNTVQVTKTSNQVEFELTNGGIGLDIVRKGDQMWFETTQPEARATDLAIGDAVKLVAMGDNGALGQGSHYWGTIEEIDTDHDLAWIGQVRG